ncbi:6-carboxytetrahydropterin synthase QueD [candidate division WWE3 bacterium]|uniref:6-carboxy-5,6,7,8-tetrahydropterin synthase n=1 Tax=candidate division WWE3 bacterium TaxID=2053526 RepID=A0A3A4ZL78_UNCKA|nr:MAG: 6-carboxytetrahydropterin synthase QueD [candidate division WWE3 bacterium]
MYFITKEFTFDAGHRLLYYKGACHNLHGHTYKLQVTVVPTSETLSKDGMVIDFSIMKGIIKKWLDETYDHCMMLNVEDMKVKELCRDLGLKWIGFPCEPTAENMARIFYSELKGLFASQGIASIALSKIDIWETPTSKASYYE